MSLFLLLPASFPTDLPSPQLLDLENRGLPRMGHPSALGQRHLPPAPHRPPLSPRLRLGQAATALTVVVRGKCVGVGFKRPRRLRGWEGKGSGSEHRRCGFVSVGSVVRFACSMHVATIPFFADSFCATRGRPVTEPSGRGMVMSCSCVRVFLCSCGGLWGSGGPRER